MSNVRVVLDTTALVSYAQLKGMATAELVAMVEEDGGASLVGIPAACFLFAYEQLAADEQERLVNLATKIDGVTVILPLTGTDTIEVAGLGSNLGHALIEARRRESYLATYEAQAALQELEARWIIDLSVQ